MASEEVLQGKKVIFQNRKGTTHWPVSSVIGASRLIALLIMGEHEPSTSRETGVS
jgi:hypothetical protein